MIECKSFDVFDIKELKEDGSFEGLGAVFGNIDRDGDVIVQGAFKNSLSMFKAQGKLPAMLWMHQMTQPIGAWESMEETDAGLVVKGKLWVDGKNPVDNALLAQRQMKSNGPSGLSIGFRTLKANWGTQDGEDVRFIEDTELFEVSPVTVPANQFALVTAAKSMLLDSGNMLDKRNAEKSLREAGMSREKAKAFVSTFGLVNLRDAEGTDTAKNLRDAEAKRQSRERILEALQSATKG